MQLNPYLSFNGNCAAAFRFYEKALGGKIAMSMTYGESPMADQTPPEFRDKIMHTRLITGDAVLMGSDAPPGRYQQASGITVALGVDTAAEAERIFHALAAHSSTFTRNALRRRPFAGHRLRPHLRRSPSLSTRSSSRTSRVGRPRPCPSTCTRSSTERSIPRSTP